MLYTFQLTVRLKISTLLFLETVVPQITFRFVCQKQPDARMKSKTAGDIGQKTWLWLAAKKLIGATFSPGSSISLIYLICSLFVSTILCTADSLSLLSQVSLWSGVNVSLCRFNDFLPSYQSAKCRWFIIECIPISETMMMCRTSLFKGVHLKFTYLLNPKTNLILKPVQP